jgi:lipid-A-disaccharide synthase
VRRVLVSAGDPSGDLILAKLVESLREQSRETGAGDIEFVGLCGPAAEAAGVKVIASAKEVAVVGITEVLRNLPHLFGVLNRLKTELVRVDSVLLLDFPDFNLRLAELARKAGKPVDYVVAPQVWAWRGGRLDQIRQRVRRMYPALPFEEEVFREAGIDARFLGHPIRDLLPPKARRAAREELAVSPEDHLIAILPGSRHSEIRKHLPLLIEAWGLFLALEAKQNLGKHARHRAVVPLAPGWTREEWLGLLEEKDRARLLELERAGDWILTHDSRRALMAADFGWIVSGTASLEAALYLVPHILLYRLSPISAFLIKRLSHYFSDENAAAGLPNILLRKMVIPELLQDRVSARALAIESYELLGNPARLDEMAKSLRFLPKKLGEAGATRRIASDLLAAWGVARKGG